MNHQKGYILVTLGGTFVILLTAFALVADFGHIYVAKGQLQNTSDAAALAAVVELPSNPAAAMQKAQSFGGSHWDAGEAITIVPDSVVLGHYDIQQEIFHQDLVPFNSVQVQAARANGAPQGALGLFFAPLFGKETSDVRAMSLAVLDPHVVGVHGKNRLIPYSVIMSVVDRDLNGAFDIGAVINIHPRNDAPGNFGFLDLDKGSNDIPELRAYIENGYDKDFLIPPGGSVPVSGSTGITGNSLLNSFTVILGEVVFLPVHTTVINPGDNAIFNVVALLAVKVLATDFTSAPQNRYIRVQIINFASSVLVVDPAAPANNSVAKPRLVM